MVFAINIRPFDVNDAAHVRELFVRVNRLLAPPHMQQAFEDYIAASLTEEVDRIAEYYGGREAASGWRLRAKKSSGCSDWSLRRRKRWSCAECTLILMSGGEASLEKCCAMPKTSAGDAICPG